jgi:hypothetical protein
LIVDWKRFWIAPSVLRSVLTEVSAASMLWIVEFAPATLSTFCAFTNRESRRRVARRRGAGARKREASPDESTRWFVESIDAYTPGTCC